MARNSTKMMRLAQEVAGVGYPSVMPEPAAPAMLYLLQLRAHLAGGRALNRQIRVTVDPRSSEDSLPEIVPITHTTA